MPLGHVLFRSFIKTWFYFRYLAIKNYPFCIFWIRYWRTTHNLIRNFCNKTLYRYLLTYFKISQGNKPKRVAWLYINFDVLGQTLTLVKSNSINLTKSFKLLTKTGLLYHREEMQWERELYLLLKETYEIYRLEMNQLYVLLGNLYI